MKDGKKWVLIVEDEFRLRRMLKDFFGIKGYGVLEAADGEEAVEQFYNHNEVVDLVLLDVMLPKLDGFEVLKEIRKNSDTAVIMLTARGTEYDQVSGFEKGADDYIVKPFSTQVLLGHVEAVLKRGRTLLSKREKVGLLEVDRDSRQVIADGREISLTSKEYEVLLYFIDNRHVSIRRETILDNVWGLAYEGDQRTVDTHIKQLRGKLPESCSYIKTVYGFGYRFEETEEENGK